MGRNKRLGLLVLAMAALVMSSLACGGTDEVAPTEETTSAFDTAADVAGNEDDQLVALSEAVTEEVEALSEACQLGSLWQQVGSENKVKFLAKIHDGCVSDSREIEWMGKWNEVSPIVSWTEYKSSD